MDGQFHLSWRDVSNGAATFVIERKEGNQESVPIVELPPNTTTFVDPKVFFTAPTIRYRIYATTHE